MARRSDVKRFAPANLAGRNHRSGPGLAVDLLAQCADRLDRHDTRAQSSSGKFRATHRFRHRRPAERFGRVPRDHVGAGAREQCRLGQL